MSFQLQFFKALQSNNIQKAKELIIQDKLKVNDSLFPPGVNSDLGHYPPLCAAAESGNLEIVRLLLEKKADPNASIGCNGMTPLYIASQDGFKEMVRLLITAGADINKFTTDESPCNPLLIACQFGHISVVKELAKKGANKDVVKPDDGNTPLLLSLKTIRLDIAEYLIQQGCDMTKSNIGGITCLMLASNRGMHSIVRLALAAGLDPEDEDKVYGMTAVDHAKLAGQDHILELLKENILERIRLKQQQQQAESSSSNGSVGGDSTTDSEMQKVETKFENMKLLKGNMYENNPLQPHEIAANESFSKEIKGRNICGNITCEMTEMGRRLSKCDRCRCIRYCSVECQKAHWKIHKPLCKKPIL